MVGRTENIRDIAIAMTSTSALLLTILAVGRLPSVGPPPLLSNLLGSLGKVIAIMALIGLYMTIILGASIMGRVMSEEPKERSLRGRGFRNRMHLMFFFFSFGLIAITSLVAITLMTS